VVGLYKTVVRIYRIPPQVRGDLQSFLEALTRRIKTPVASITVKGDTIRIEMSGPRDQVFKSLAALRAFFGEYKVDVGKRAWVFTFDKIESIAGIGIPVDTLEELLRLRGYPARRRTKRSKSVETTAPREVVVEEIKRLAEAYSKVRGERMSEGAMKLVVVASAYLGVDPQSVIRKALEIGVVVRESDGKLRVDYAWRGALREVIRAYRAST
jgi:hypothetical protein